MERLIVTKGYDMACHCEDYRRRRRKLRKRNVERSKIETHWADHEFRNGAERGS